MVYTPAFSSNFFSGGGHNAPPTEPIHGAAGGTGRIWKMLLAMGLAGYLVYAVAPAIPGSVDFDKILEDVQKQIEARTRKKPLGKPFGLPQRPFTGPSVKEIRRIIEKIKPAPPMAPYEPDHDYEEPQNNFMERRRRRRGNYYYPYTKY